MPITESDHARLLAQVEMLTERLKTAEEDLEAAQGAPGEHLLAHDTLTARVETLEPFEGQAKDLAARLRDLPQT